jgi:hypothetical protein
VRQESQSPSPPRSLTPPPCPPPFCRTYCRSASTSRPAGHEPRFRHLEGGDRGANALAALHPYVHELYTPAIASLANVMINGRRRYYASGPWEANFFPEALAQRASDEQRVLPPLIWAR